ncbi:hypothetical protein Dimus_022791, partial [Dionaea muscipula]
QKLENLFKRRELMHMAACKELYKNLTVSISKKKEVARSCVEILGVPGNNGICEYIKDIWEESIYCKPLPITRKFANNNLLSCGKEDENVVPRFGKRDTTSFMDLTYMDHLLMRTLVNLPRVMLRHMAYVISVENHELSRRDDEDEGVNNENAPAENLEENPEGFEWEAVNDEAEIQGGEMEKGVEVEASGSDDEFYDAEVEVEEPADEIVEVPAVPAFPASPADSTNMQQKERTASGVDPSGPTGSLPDSDFLKLQEELDRARSERLQAELDKARTKNARLQALLLQATSQPKP